MAERQPSLKWLIAPYLTLLLHLLRGHWSDFFEPCLRFSTSDLVVSVRKWFRSVDKCGRRQLSLIFPVIAFLPKPLEEFCRNLAYEFLLVSRYVRPKMILVCQQIWTNGGHLKSFLKTCPRCSGGSLVVSARKSSGPSTNMAAGSHL